MSDLTSGHVLTGYIPAKFGTQLVHIDAAHPLASQLVRELPQRTRPVIVIEGGEYDGQLVDLNDVSLDYAMGQLGTRYDLVGSVDGFSPARIVAKPADEPPAASSACPVCGVDTPHTHDEPATASTSAPETAAPESQTPQSADVPVADRKRRGAR